MAAAFSSPAASGLLLVAAAAGGASLGSLPGLLHVASVPASAAARGGPLAPAVCGAPSWLLTCSLSLAAGCARGLEKKSLGQRACRGTQGGE